jgi:hypothetical protein
MRTQVQEEAAAIAPAHALLAQMEHQRRHLQHVSQHLPQRLPGCPPPPLTSGKENSASNALSVPSEVNNSGEAAVTEKPVPSRASEAVAPRPTTGRKKKAAELPVPRHYVTVRYPLPLSSSHPAFSSRQRLSEESFPRRRLKESHSHGSRLPKLT